MGSKVTDFCGPVINQAAYDRISGIIAEAKSDAETEIIEGGECDDSVGFDVVRLSLFSYIPTGIMCAED